MQEMLVNRSLKCCGALAVGMLSMLGPELARAKTYAPAELRAMIDAGRYPAQGKSTTHKTSMGFDACVQSASNVVASIGANYPAKVIVSTDAMKLVKIWTNDGVVTVTCSAPDRAMVTSQAPYL